MALRFTAFHPLTHVPCSLDSLVRLGFEPKSTTSAVMKFNNFAKRAKQSRQPREPREPREPRQSRGSRQQRTSAPVASSTSSWEEPSISDESEIEPVHASLCHTLHLLEKHLNSSEEQLKKEKDEHEEEIRQSISEKQEARTKNGAAVKGSELDEIAKAVRTADEKTWYLASNIDQAKERVTTLLENVHSLQSADRKAANATLRVVVPDFYPLPWVNQNTELDGW